MTPRFTLARYTEYRIRFYEVYLPLLWLDEVA